MIRDLQLCLMLIGIVVEVDIASLGQTVVGRSRGRIVEVIVYVGEAISLISCSLVFASLSTHSQRDQQLLSSLCRHSFKSSQCPSLMMRLFRPLSWSSLLNPQFPLGTYSIHSVSHSNHSPRQLSHSVNVLARKRGRNPDGKLEADDAKEQVEQNCAGKQHVAGLVVVIVIPNMVKWLVRS
jgi:hypothetical protein